jgi:hypothetical protein
MRPMSAERLAHIRGSRGTAEFAASLGIHRNTYRSWEIGRTDISGEGLRALALLGWNPMWVLTGNGPERLDGSTLLDLQAYRALAASGDSDAADRVALFEDGFFAGMKAAREASETAPNQASQSVRIDPGRLQGAVELLSAMYVALGGALDPVNDADLIAMAYDALEDSDEGSLKPSNVIDLAQRIRARREGTGNEKGPVEPADQGSAGAHGGAKRKQ